MRKIRWEKGRDCPQITLEAWHIWFIPNPTWEQGQDCPQVTLAPLVYPKSHPGMGSGLSPGHTGTSALSQISPGRGWNGIPVGTEPPCRLQGWGQSLNEHFRHYGNSLLTPAILTRARTLFLFFQIFLVLFPFNLPTDLSFSLSPLSSLSFNKAGREITIPEAETTRICEAFSSLLILQIPPQTLQHPGTNTRKRFWTLNIHRSKKNPEYPIPGSAQGRVGQSLGWVLKPFPTPNYP